MALSRNDQFLDAIVNGTGRINVYRIEDNGRLTPVRGGVSVPPFSQGIVAF